MSDAPVVESATPPTPSTAPEAAPPPPPAVKLLDSWAVLAWLRDQAPGAEAVETLWAAAKAGQIRLLMSIINLGEVYYITAKVQSVPTAEWVLAELQALPLEVGSVSNNLVLGAARLKGQYAISYADAFAVATAIRERAVIVTGDPEFKVFVGSGLVRVEWIGA